MYHVPPTRLPPRPCLWNTPAVRSPVLFPSGASPSKDLVLSCGGGLFWAALDIVWNSFTDERGRVADGRPTARRLMLAHRLLFVFGEGEETGGRRRMRKPAGGSARHLDTRARQSCHQGCRTTFTLPSHALPSHALTSQQPPLLQTLNSLAPTPSLQLHFRLFFFGAKVPRRHKVLSSPLPPAL